MIEKDNPIISIILDSGKIVLMRLQDAIDAGLIDEKDGNIEDKQRLPQSTKRKYEKRR